jgi:hypothetical protein
VVSILAGSDIDKIAPALVKALGELADPTKAGKAIVKSERAVYGYTYLELSDLLAEVRRVFAARELAVLQSPEYADGTVRTVTVVLHSSGQSVTTPPLVIRCSSDAQSIGSAISYSRRYQLAALVGLVGSNDDDDGQRAQQGAQQPRTSPQQDSEHHGQTRPVKRAQGAAEDRDPRWTTPPPQPDTAQGHDAPPPDHPVPDDQQPQLGAPSRRTSPSEKSTKLMWTLLRKTGMSTEQIRTWVHNVLPDTDEDWSTSDLSQAQVSAIITRLQEWEQAADQQGTP